MKDQHERCVDKVIHEEIENLWKPYNPQCQIDASAMLRGGCVYPESLSLAAPWVIAKYDAQYKGWVVAYNGRGEPHASYLDPKEIIFLS